MNRKLKIFFSVLILFFIFTGVFLYLFRNDHPGAVKFSVSAFSNANKETRKVLNQLDSWEQSKNNVLPDVTNDAFEATGNKNKLCELLSSGHSSELSESAIRKIVFSTPNKFSSDKIMDRTSEFIIANLVAAGPIDPDAPVDTNDVIEFYRALVFGGLIEPFDYPKLVDYKKAEQILLQLEERQPENGAFTFFRAGVALKSGLSEESQRSLFVKAMSAGQFETYHTSIWRPVLQRSFEDPERSLLSWALVSQARIINYSIPFSALRNLIKSSDQEFAKLALEFSKKVYPKHFPDQGRFEFYEWFALDHGYSELIRYNALKKIYPNKKIPFAKRLSEVVTWNKDELIDLLKADKEGHPICDIRKIADFIRNQELLYREFIAKHGVEN